MAWHNHTNFSSKVYTCGYCGNSISSNTGYVRPSGAPGIYICHFCDSPTFFDQSGKQYPGVAYGKKFNPDIAPEIIGLYDEARNCMSINAFTSAGMCCRKLLMNIAVNKGAKEGLKFKEYVDYLDDNHFIAVGAKPWVDIIRTKGNEATHEIKLLTYEEAKQLIDFIEILITTMYEIPSRVPNATPTNP